VSTNDSAFRAGIPKPLFEVRLPGPRRNRYLATRDGQRFLVNVPAEQSTVAPIHVLLNWSAGIAR